MAHATRSLLVPTAEHGHATWARIRAHGPIHFIFFWGMLGFGGLTILVQVLWNWDTLTLPVLLDRAVETLQTAMMWGIAVWLFGEWRFAKSEEAIKKK